MLDLKFIRENPDAVRSCLASRRNTSVDVGAILNADEMRRKLQHEMDQLRAEQNKASQEIGRLKKSGQDAKHQTLFIFHLLSFGIIRCAWLL